MRQPRSKDIQKVRYHPPEVHGLDIEVLPVAELRERAGDHGIGMLHRIDFYLLLCITDGKCTHMVDFEPVDCTSGSVLLMHPSQAQQFDASPVWSGWVVIFKPEFLAPLQEVNTTFDLWMNVHLEGLGNVLQLVDVQRRPVESAMEQMYADSQIDASPAILHTLLRHQLYALLLRLQILQGEQTAVQAGGNPASLQRFKRFEHLVEKHFAHWHQVKEYAAVAGCSEKSLNRAVVEATRDTTKAYISRRIILEAKRLLAHTNMPIAVIAEKVGFNEATNFTKFFKRESDCTPAEFRDQQSPTATAPYRRHPG